MRPARRRRRRVPLGAIGSLTRCLSVSLARGDERALASDEAWAEVRRALRADPSQLGRLQALLATTDFADPLPRRPSEAYRALEAAVRGRRLLVVERRRELSRLDHGHVVKEPGEPDEATTNKIADKSLLISRCDPELGPGRDDPPLRFTYMLRGLEAQAVELRIHAAGLSAPIVHRRVLEPSETLDGAHDAQWDGHVSSPGHLLDRRLPPGYGPCRVELYADDSYRDQAPFCVRTRRPAPAIVARGFASGSSFVGPGIAAALKPTQERLDEAGARLALFGHSDPSGAAAVNKALSERRAAAVRALACSDLDAFLALGDDEGWGVDCYQAMLRGLSFVPGPIDGKAGPLTGAAVEAFVEAQDRGWLDAPAPSPGPELDASTRRAIAAAYVEEYGVGVDPERLLTEVACGCREFNTHAKPKDPALERRVTLAVFRPSDDPPGVDDFPCAKGDSGACELDRAHDGQGTPRCAFYRRTITSDTGPDPVEFFDFAWLRLPSGKIHLSALTTAPDTDEVEVEIGVADGGLALDPPNSASADAPLELRTLGHARGHVRHGVCYARWDPEGFDPFDPRQWFETDPNAAEIEGLPVPTFKLTIGRDWAYSTPPGRRLDRIALSGEVGGEVIALLADGSYARFDGREGLQQLAAEAGGLHAVAIYPRNAIIPDSEADSP